MTKYELRYLTSKDGWYNIIDLGWKFSLKDAKEDAEYLVNMLRSDGIDVVEYHLFIS